MRGSSVGGVLALCVWLGSAVGTDAQTERGTPPVLGAACVGAEAWLEATWERHERAGLLTQRLGLLLEQALEQGSLPDATLLDEIGGDLRALAREQAASDPPPAANELDAVLGERLEKYAEGAELYAGAVRQDDDRVADRAADLVHEGSQLGIEGPQVAERFKLACDLTDHEAFGAPPCYGHPAYRWYASTLTRVNRVETVAGDAFGRLDDVAGLRRAILEVEDLLAAQEESETPGEGEALDALVIDLFRTYVAILDAAATGDFGEVERLGEEGVALGERIATADAELAAICAAATPEATGRGG